MLFGDASSYKTTKWSGGQTQEIYIFPGNSSYHSKDFEFRISTATVSKAGAPFTPLLGYHRILMPLRKPMRLEVNDRIVKVPPFKTYYFSGSDHVDSLEKNIDLNIMVNDQWTADLQVINLDEQSLFSGTVDGFFCASGSGYLISKKVGFTLKLSPKDCILFVGDGCYPLIFKATDANFKVININLKRG